MKKLHLNQFGDTIVEVMIAVVVLSMAIGGAYAIASRSLRSARQSQERAEALKIAETQLENVKSLAVAGNAALFTTQNFCFNPGITTSACRINDLYDVQVTSTSLGDNNRHQFDVRVEWDSLTSGSRNQLTLNYRVINESNL